MSDPILPPPPVQHYPGPGSAIMLTMSALFAMAFIIMMFGEKADLGAVGFAQVVGFGAIAMLAHQRIPEPQSERLGLRGIDPSFISTMLMLMPMVFLTSELDNILRDLSRPVPLEADVLEMLSLTNASVWSTLQRVIVLVGLAPVMEEWLFRGVIQQGMVGRLGRVRGLIFTSLLFALVQLFPGTTSSSVLAYFPIAFANGMVFGIVRLASGSLLAAMIVHAGFNAIAVAGGYGAEAFPILGFNVSDTHTTLSVLLPSAALAGVAFSRLRRLLGERSDEIPLPQGTNQRRDFDL